MAPKSSDTLNVVLGAELIKRLDALAKAQERSKGFLVRKAVEKYLDEIEAAPAN